MVIGTVGVLLLTQIDTDSTYTDFLPPLLLLGFAIGLSVSPATDTIMGSFPESELGVGGGANDTALELGGSLGIAILGSLLGTAYQDKLTDMIGGQLPAAALDAAKDSVGGGLAVAEAGREEPRAAGRSRRRPWSRPCTSPSPTASPTPASIGGIIMAAGTLIVLAVLPGRRTGESGTAEPSVSVEVDREPEFTDAH